MRRASSLRRKLIVIIVVGSAFTSVIAAAGFTWWDYVRSSERIGAEVTTLANIVGDQVSPAVTLADKKAAEEILSSLRSDVRIRDAVLYTNEGRCFASFHRGNIDNCPPPGKDGIQRQAGLMLVSVPVRSKDDRVGALLLAVNLPSIAAVLEQYVRGAALIVVLTLIVAAVLVIVLQFRVTSPILTIARVAQEMAETHHFGARVSLWSNDEIGVLANSFNTMLDQIEARDGELARQRQRLEQEVAERSRVNGELQLAKEKAEEAARLKSEFLANMSHEIRTPLNGVTGMISLAVETCTQPEQREQLLVAKNAATSLTAILNDILDLSRMEAGKLRIETVAFDLRSTLQDCVRIFSEAVQEKKLALTLEIPPACPHRVLGDPVRLRQILINLIGNAVKFTLQGSVHVRVSAPTSGLLRFDVQDTGIGIPSDKFASIFEAFTQADGSHTRRFGGSGLGLTITKHLVTLIGGEITVQSEPGRGSQFTVQLPLQTTRAEAPSSELNKLSLEDLPRMHVLVAEDNVVNQKVATSILRRQGWTAKVASTGKQAYEMFLNEHFDLVLMDVQMPELDGLEATLLIRQEEERRGLSRIPIVALTAHAAPAQHEQCVAHGMDAIVTKPIDIPALFDAIREVVAPNPFEYALEN